GAEQRLDLYRVFGRELEHGAVEMGTECHRALVDLTQVGERHYLETAGICEDRQRPVHEFMQTAEGGDALRARSAHQVIGIAEHDLGARLAYVFGREPLHCPLRADWHEGGSSHAAMPRDKFAKARAGIAYNKPKGKGRDHRLVG